MRERRLIAAQAAFWRWLNWSRRRPRLTLCAWVAAAAAAVWVAAALLAVNTDTGDMIAADVPYRSDQAAMDAAFPRLQDQVLVLVRADSEDAVDAFARRLRDALEQRTDAVAGVFAPAIDPFFDRNGLLYLEMSALEGLFDRLNRAAPLIERLAATPSLAVLFDALAEGLERADGAADAEALDSVMAELARVIDARLADAPRGFSWRAVFDTEAEEALHQRLLTLEPRQDFGALVPAARVHEAVADAVDQARDGASERAEVHLTGDPILRSEELRSVSEGIGAAFMLSFVGVAAVLMVGLRSARLAFATVGAVIVSIALTAGFAAVTVGALNLVSIAFAVLMLGLGVDFAIHLALHAQGHRRRGLAVRGALYQSARGIGGAFAVAAVTTALAFLAFAPTQFTGMAQLGVIAAMGVLIAFAVTTSVVAATLALLPPPRPLVRGLRTEPPAQSAARRRALAWLILALGAGALLLAPHARFDADPMGLRDPDAASVIAFDRLFDEPDFQPFRLSVLASDLAQAEALAETLAWSPEVESARTPADFVPDNQSAKRELIDFAAFGLEAALSPPAQPDGDREAAEARLSAVLAQAETPAALRLAQALRALADATPAQREDVQADVFRYWPAALERLRAQLAPEVISLETLPAALRARYFADSGEVRIDVSPAADLRETAAQRAFVDAVTAIAPTASGPARSVLAAGEVVARAMLVALGLAALAVTAIVYGALRDARTTALILATLALAGLLTAASGVLVGMPFNFANVIVLPLLIGLGVDSAVHLALRARGLSGPEGVYDTTTPRAVIFSSLTTIASFASLAVSPHQGTASMGALLAIALFWTSTCTIVVLPYLMKRFGVRSLGGADGSATEEELREHSAQSS